MANNGNHFLWYHNLSDTYKNVSNWSRANNYDPIIGVETFKSSDHNSADVAVYDKNVNANWYGVYYCEVYVSGGYTHCKHAHVEFNTGKSAPSKRSLACHEFEHSFGSNDYPGGTGEAKTCGGDNDWYDYLSSHDVAHIEETT